VLNHNTNVIRPFRLSRSQAATCDPKHTYTKLQEDAHAGLMDQFVQTNPDCPTAMGVLKVI
jgi:hypothetical protein